MMFPIPGLTVNERLEGGPVTIKGTHNVITLEHFVCESLMGNGMAHTTTLWDILYGATMHTLAHVHVNSCMGNISWERRTINSN